MQTHACIHVHVHSKETKVSPHRKVYDNGAILTRGKKLNIIPDVTEILLIGYSLCFYPEIHLAGRFALNKDIPNKFRPC